MKSHEILEQYSDLALSKLSADKIEESVTLRLPRSVIIQESIEALNSMSYVAKALAPTRPPTYAFLKLLMDAVDHSLPIEGFQEKVLQETVEIRSRAESGKGLSDNKDYKLYSKILKVAWEDETIERNEALLLQALRNELGIWFSEHLLLEHHPEVTNIDNFSTSYTDSRNHLLITGLVLTHDQKYVISEEVQSHIRKLWGIELENASYMRLLGKMTKTQLYNILEKNGLLLAGSKDEQIQRVFDSLVPPSAILDIFNIEDLRDFCRDIKAPVSGLKSEVIWNIIEHFDSNHDLRDDEHNKKDLLPLEPEERVINNQILNDFFYRFSNDQLYDILSSSFLKTSGTKEMKVKRLIESPWSERSLLKCLRRVEISNICRKLGIQTSGVKEELIDRLIDWNLNRNISNSEVDLLKTETNKINDDSVVSVDKPNTNMIEIKENTRKTTEKYDINRDYPDLEQDESTIISLLKDMKSMTEKEIQRASENHGFEWFLTKAHMAEILAKLKRNGVSPIRVKSVKSTNIYEWAGANWKNRGEIEKAFARDVINALRQGVVPENNLDLLVVGQENARTHLTTLLDEINDNKSAFKFIRGHYGDGKTFLCSWLRQYALDNEFAVSLVNIGPGQPLSDLPVFFSGIINGLRTPEKRDSCALADVLESWLLSVHRATAQIEGLKAFDISTRDKLIPLVEERIESKLASIAAIDPCFPPALRAFYHARMTGDQVMASNAIAWLSGSRSIPAKILNEIGVRGYLEANQVFLRMRALLEIIGGSRFKGLLLIVDELELIRKFPHTKQREQALETIRLLIDESGKNGFPSCFLVFTGTDTFFEDDRYGLKSYEALYNRVSAPGGGGVKISIRQPVITLERLNRERLHLMIGKIRDIHGIAYEWNSRERISDDFLNDKTSEWTDFGDISIEKKPRPVLRELINILDVCEENPGVELTEFLGISVDENLIARELDDILKN